MPSPKRLLFALFCAFLLYPALSRAVDLNSPEPKRINLRIRLVDTAGNPIAGAAVQVWKRHDLRQLSIPDRADPIQIGDKNEIRTDSDGKAAFSISLPVVPAGFHMWRNSIFLTAAAENHLVCRGGPIDSAKSDSLEATMILRRLTTIEGRVVDQQGAPVAGAVVFHTGNNKPKVETKTNSQGHFKLGELPEGKSPVFVTHPDFHFHGQLVDTSSDKQEFKLLSKDQTPPAMTTLPPLIAHDEELKIARQAISQLWEKTKNSKNDDEKKQVLLSYAKIDPWRSYAEAKTLLNKNYFHNYFYQIFPKLYSTDSEEALAELESLELDKDYKTEILLRAVRESEGISREQKIELLDRAIISARAIAEPNDRIDNFSSIALALYDAGKAAEAKIIVAELKPVALKLSAKENDYACVSAAKAIALFDLTAGVRLAQNIQNDSSRMETIFKIAKRLAAENPSQAERIAVEALDAQLAKSEKEYRENNKQDWPEDEKFNVLWDYETNFAPICYRMSPVDLYRAERIALKMQIPNLRAYYLGLIAKTLAVKDKDRARKLILKSYEILAEAATDPRRYYHGGLGYSLPSIAGSLLPIVEEIDPALVGECMWRTLCFRLYRPVDDFLIRLEPELDDVNLALFIARYDRTLASALMPPGNVIAVPPIYSFWRIMDPTFSFDSKKMFSCLNEKSLSPYEVTLEVDELLLDPLRRWDGMILPYQ
ncbi:MAG: carboxypeptidase-like regulatory domain-containing protein [Thermoguttaceae bacterium]|jgi:hypothetical protein